MIVGVAKGGVLLRGGYHHVLHLYYGEDIIMFYTYATIDTETYTKYYVLRTQD